MDFPNWSGRKENKTGLLYDGDLSSSFPWMRRPTQEEATWLPGTGRLPYPLLPSNTQPLLAFSCRYILTRAPLARHVPQMTLWRQLSHRGPPIMAASSPLLASFFVCWWPPLILP